MKEKMVTDDEFVLIQKIYSLSRIGHPATPELVNQAADLIGRGLVEINGMDLNIPQTVQIEVVASGRVLKAR